MKSDRYVIRQAYGRQYLTASGDWTPEPTAAQAFERRATALAEAPRLTYGQGAVIVPLSAARIAAARRKLSAAEVADLLDAFIASKGTV